MRWLAQPWVNRWPVLPLLSDITYFTTWDDRDQIFLHWGVGEIEGFVWRYAVESHSPEITAVEVAMIEEAFEVQLVQHMQTPETIQ